MRGLNSCQWERPMLWPACSLDMPLLFSKNGNGHKAHKMTVFTKVLYYRYLQTFHIEIIRKIWWLELWTWWDSFVFKQRVYQWEIVGFPLIVAPKTYVRRILFSCTCLYEVKEISSSKFCNIVILSFSNIVLLSSDVVVLCLQWLQRGPLFHDIVFRFLLGCCSSINLITRRLITVEQKISPIYIVIRVAAT